VPRSSSILAVYTLVAYATVLLVPCVQSPSPPQEASTTVHAERSAPADPHAAHDHGQAHAPAQERVHPPTHARAGGHAQAHGHAQHGAPAETESHAAHARVEGDAAMGEADEHGSAPCEIRAVCLCGCEGAPKAAPSTTRVSWSIAAAEPTLPHPPEHVLGSDALPSLPGAPSGSIDHVPIPT
jgi:hypothetical protein